MTDKRPTPEQVATAHAFGEAMLKLLIALRPEEPKAEKPAPPPNMPAVQGDALPGRQAEAEPLMVGPSEAGKMLRIARRTLQRWTTPNGPIPAMKLGRLVRYSVADLKEWVGRAGKRKPGDERTLAR